MSLENRKILAAEQSYPSEVIDKMMAMRDEIESNMRIASRYIPQDQVDVFSAYLLHATQAQAYATLTTAMHALDDAAGLL